MRACIFPRFGWGTRSAIVAGGAGLDISCFVFLFPISVAGPSDDGPSDSSIVKTWYR